MRRDRRGFTLVELLAALTVSALVITGARGVLESLRDSGSRAQERVQRHDSVRAAQRMLADLLTNASASGDTSLVFVGWPRAMRFDTWCDSPYGGSERCQVELAIADGPSGATVRLTLGAEPPITVPVTEAPVAFIYMERSPSAGAWHSGWGKSLYAPSAVGILVGSDTLVFGVGRTP